MHTALLIIAVVFALGTALPIFEYDHWWIRALDFPRLQIALGGLVLLGLYVAFWDTEHALEGTVLGALVLAVGWQIYKIYPYTPLAPEQVASTVETDPENSLKVLVANVLQHNRASEKLLKIIRDEDPDVVLTLETDAWWAAQLKPLEERYPHTVEQPLDNTYGMLLHARLELVESEVRFLFEEGVPSIHTQVRLPSGRLVYLHALHPKPPFPKEDTDTTERDAELLTVGRLVRGRDAPTIVAGDLNDVAWSFTTDLFQKTSGLLDPRNGRGMFNTFHAKYPLFRCPLDHVFHSDHFKLVALKRLPYFGSDHFPVLVHLQCEDGAVAEQEEPVADRKSKEKADQKIGKAERIKADLEAARRSDAS